MWIILIALFLLGAFVGGQVNRGIYRLAWNKRCIGPWSAPHPEAASRAWFDRIPIVGWIGMRRESALHGPAFWVRPLLIELCTGCGFAALYQWEASGRLYDPPFVPPSTTFLYQYGLHILLVSLMVVATFIDFDEKTIPDSITVPGTLLALALVSWFPESALPAKPVMANYPHLAATSPQPWTDWLHGGTGLAIALGIVLFWALAIMPRHWVTRHGFSRAMQYLIGGLVRDRAWLVAVSLAVPLGLWVAVLWWMRAPVHWAAMFSGLVGMLFGGCLVWAIRLVGSWAMQREAMGFGDVTLMFMIGAFLGWQPALLTFFLAPFAALFIAGAQWMLTGKKDLAFGPYLCLGALLVIVLWPMFWRWAQPICQLGWITIAILLICLAIMPALLTLIRAVEDLFRRPDHSPSGTDAGE